MAIEQTSVLTGKTASVVARELDHAINDIAAINAQLEPSPGSLTLQDVLDEGNTSTTGIIIEDDNNSTVINPDGIVGGNGALVWSVSSETGEGVFTDGSTTTIINPNGISGLNGESVTWEIDNESGQAQFSGISNSNGEIKPYKVYVANLTQSGTSAPVETIFENNIGTLSWSYDGVGGYSVTSSGLFTLNKTTIEIGQNYGGSGSVTYAYVNDADSCSIESKALTTGSAQDGNLIQTKVEIRVYP